MSSSTAVTLNIDVKGGHHITLHRKLALIHPTIQRTKNIIAFLEFPWLERLCKIYIVLFLLRSLDVFIVL